MTPPAVLLPSYQFSPGFFVRWLFTVLVLRRRLHAGRNALEMLAGKPRPRVEGLERLPASGPCVVVMNHYERPGLRVWWASRSRRPRSGSAAAIRRCGGS